MVVNCIDEQSEVRTVTGRTLCGIYEAPYTWNFEGNNPSVAPDCWEVLSGSIYVENSSSAHDGSQHLRFGSSTNGIIVLPEFTTDANTLQMSLWLRPSNNTAGSGNYTYTLADTVHFSATANSGYCFVEWILDGGTSLDTLDAEYQSAYVPASTWMAFGNVTLTAVFEAEPTTGIDNVEDGSTAISAAGLRIVVEGAEHQDIRIYSVDGRCVRMQTDAPTAAEFAMDAAGVYMVKVGDRPARRIVIVR